MVRKDASNVDHVAARAQIGEVNANKWDWVECVPVHNAHGVNVLRIRCKFVRQKSMP